MRWMSSWPRQKKHNKNSYKEMKIRKTMRSTGSFKGENYAPNRGEA